MLLQLVQHPSNSLYVLFALALNIDENVIKVHYLKNVKLFCPDLVNISLQYGWCIGQSKRHDLVFEVVITGLEGRFLFVSFPNPHLVVDIDQIKLGELSSPT